jgi:anti-sigma regulatory factor (Ser/Thr protein kinase)
MVVSAQNPNSQASIERAAANEWWLTYGTSGLAEVGRVRNDSTWLPSQILGRSARSTGPRAVVLAKIELDVCGAWVTVSNAGAARPILVRRAGWVEVRGHPAPKSGTAPADDRIGLGPADMLLFCSSPSEQSGSAGADETLFDLALGAAGSDPTELVQRVSGQADCLGIGVPADLGDPPIDRVARATGLAPDEVESPGYPLGDLQPDLWKEPPPPPRLARLRLTQDRTSVGVVRSLLDRLLASWRLLERVDAGDLKLLSSELAANAVVHAGFPDTITIRYLGPKIRVEVRDTSPDFPQKRDAGATAESGRGMHLVEVLASSWGVDPTSDGKQVWCEVPVA